MPNKAHKQRHASKRALAAREQGRHVSGAQQRATNPKSSASSSARAKQSALAKRSNKIKTALQMKRLGCGYAPRIIGFLALNESATPSEVATSIATACGSDEDCGFPLTVFAKEQRTRFTLVVDEEADLQATADIAKVSDILVFALDCSVEAQTAVKEIQAEVEAEEESSTWFSNVGLCVTELSRQMVTLLNAQGVPGAVVVLQGLASHDGASRLHTLKIHKRYFESVFGDFVTVLPCPTDEDGFRGLVRKLAVTKLRPLNWREIRPYFVAESTSYCAEERVLHVEGFLRGSNLSPNQLVHLTNHGTFQVSQVVVVNTNETHVPDENREDLTAIQANDTVEDAGLPTLDDVQHATRGKKVRVPAGVSQYQAAWYEFENNGDDVDEALGSDAQTSDNDDDALDPSLLDGGVKEGVEFLEPTDVVRSGKLSREEQEEAMRKLKSLSEDDLWSPDVVDTPVHLPARQRFAKYRGMKSFQSGVWDVEENLPLQYGHIFKLQGYTKVREHALQDCASGPVPPGEYVRVSLIGVPGEVGSAAISPLLIVSGLLANEQKWSVLHFHVQRSADDDEPIKSKTPVLAHIGFRKFFTAPLFSDACVGDRTKFARYFQPGEKFRLASCYGPISYNPCPVLMFRVSSLEELHDGEGLALAAFGSVQPPNPDLLVLKRSILTGRVAMIHKKQIVVKYMFLNDADVKWFSPVDIYTKLGRRGKISKPIGTHGHFKAILNDQVMQHDVICMDLYKRVFPKWATVEYKQSNFLHKEES